MQAIAIFCGSSMGNDPIFKQVAQDVGRILAQRNITLIFGGGSVGLMGVVAESVLAHGGRAIGVITKGLLDSEIAFTGLTELHIVENMHQRKHMMAELSDAFVALPGGAGTFEEIFEQWTWAQLGIHTKPTAFLNVDNYYTPLFNMLDTMVERGFTKKIYEDMLICSESFIEILQAFEHYQAPERKWVKEK